MTSYQGGLSFDDTGALRVTNSGFTNIVYLTAGTSNASANTTAIQTALTAGGNVSLAGTGTYYINKTLYVPSYTSITSEQDLTLKMADASNCPMFTNKWADQRLDAARFAFVSIGGGNYTCTVTQPWHNFSTSNQVYIHGAVTTALNGVVTVTATTATTWSFTTTAGTVGNISGQASVFACLYNPLAGSNFVRASNVVTVTETAHKRLSGDHVAIFGLTGDTSFNGQFEIVDITANTWTYASTGSNGSPTGTAQLLGDTMISFNLAAIDYNGANQTNLYYDSTCSTFWLGNLGNSNLTIQSLNYSKFRAIDCYNLGKFTVPYAKGYNGLVFLQMEAFCNEVKVGTVDAYGLGDDVIAWGVTLGSGTFSNTASPNGPASMGNLTVDLVRGGSPTGVIKIFGTSGYDLGKMIFNRIDGIGPIVVGDSNAGVNGATITSLKLLNCYNPQSPSATSAHQIAVYSTGIGSIGYLEISGQDLTAATGTGRFAVIGSSGTISECVLSVKSTVANTTAGAICVYLTGGTFDQVVVKDSYVALNADSAATFIRQATATTIKNVQLNNVYAYAPSDGGNLYELVNGTLTNISFNNVNSNGSLLRCFLITTAQTTATTPINIFMNNLAGVNTLVTDGSTAQWGNIFVSNTRCANKYYMPINIDGSGTWTVEAANCGNYVKDSGYGFVGNNATNLKLRSLDIINTPSYAATFTPNFKQGNIIQMGSLTGNITIANGTNVPGVGQEIVFYFVQDATGGRTVSWGTNYIFPTAWTNTGNTANTTSTIAFVSNGTKLIAKSANIWT